MTPVSQTLKYIWLPAETLSRKTGVPEEKTLVHGFGGRPYIYILNALPLEVDLERM
jgi:hypothetical protein